MTEPDPPPVVLYSSRFGWLLVTAGFGFVAVFSTAALVQGGTTGPAVVLTLFTTVYLAVLRTQPWTSTVNRDGVVRRCPLRRDEIQWEAIDAFERLRRTGGLVARLATGKRRLLCDRSEGFAEHGALMAVVDAHQPGVAVATAPPVDQRPTDLYRRKGGSGDQS